jgi:hypothetical protein
MRIADTWFPKLQTLSISYIESFDRSWDRIISSITNLTLYRCRDLRDFYYLLEYAPMLKYLRINVISCDKYSFYGASNNEPYGLHLKQLIIDECWNSFNAFEMFVKQTPNLKSLTISTFDNNDMADADKWEQLITSSLHYLDIFKFNFCCRSNKHNNSIIVDKFKQFQTDFWQKQHHWFTEYAITKNFAFIYTIPYVSNEHILLPNTKRYYNNLRNNANTFINLRNLELYQKNLTKGCEYYFPNVISLTLISSDDDCLTRKRIDYLKNIVNLFNLKHLDISNYNATSSSVLLNILKQAPQLFSLSIKWSQLTSFFNDSELCKYLNKMIKRLYIDEERLYLDKRSYLDNKRFDHFIKNNDYPFEAKQFCQIFSNIEHLKCDSSHGKELLLLINHLSKLSTLHVKWLTEDKLTKYLFRFKEEVRKLNAIYKIEINPTCTCCEYEISDVLEAKWGSYYVNIFMWFGNSMS